MKPIYSPDVHLDHSREKIIDLLGYRWVVAGQKWMSLNGDGDGRISFALVQPVVLPGQFRSKMQVRAFACKMDVPGKHELFTDSDRRFTEIVEKVCFFDKEYELNGADFEREFNINFNTVDKYKEQTKDSSFSPVQDVEVFVRVSILPTEKTWGYLKKEFDNRIDLESADQAHDKVLKVGDQKFYVQSQMLAVFSGYFKKMFADESEKAEIEIKGVDPEIFHDMLKLMYQSDNVIGALNTVPLYKMASVFKVRCVFDACSKYLNDLDSGALPHFLHFIKLADKYKDGKLLLTHFRNIRCAMGAGPAHSFLTSFQSKLRNLSMETKTILFKYLSTPDPGENPLEALRQILMQMHHRG